MPVHTYGTPCDISGFDDLGAKYGIPIVYDGAHAFGVRRNGVSVLAECDASVTSFHATKPRNTFEGGAVVASTAQLANEVRNVTNFGILSEVEVTSIGINAKMNEFSVLARASIDSDILSQLEMTSHDPTRNTVQPSAISPGSACRQSQRQTSTTTTPTSRSG